MENDRQRGHEIEATGKTVGENVARIRKTQRLSLKDLEERMGRHGRRISFSGLSKIEKGSRKVDTDDLMTLALALDVSPVALLLPEGDPDAKVEVTGGHGSLAAFWQWAFGESPLIDPDWRSFQARSLPRWLEVQPEIDWHGRLELFFGVTGEDEARQSIHIYRDAFDEPSSDGQR